jgi:hypothetical protein
VFDDGTGFEVPARGTTRGSYLLSNPRRAMRRFLVYAPGRRRQPRHEALWVPSYRSIGVLWTLRELGVEFEFVNVDPTKSEHRRPEFLAVNPAGKLRVLVDGDFILTESVAIALYLAEKYPEKGLLPSGLRARAEVNRPGAAPHPVAHASRSHLVESQRR